MTHFDMNSRKRSALRHWFGRVAIVLLLTVGCCLGWGQGAQAEDLAAGKQIFDSKCASCHAGGNNIVNPAKTLKAADLDKYGMNSMDAIISQVTNGKPPMPSFKGQLSDEDMENVAAYVLSQSDKW